MRNWIKQPDLASYGFISGIKEVINSALAPFMLTLIMGFLVLALSSNADKVLIKAIEEFIQTAGLKIILMSSLFFSGLGILFSTVKYIGPILSWCAQSLSSIGFQFTAVLSGVLIGLAIPAAIEAGSLQRGLFFLSIGVFTLLIEFIWFAIAYVSNENFIQETHKIIGTKSKQFSMVFGSLLMGLGLYVLVTVEWSEVGV